MLESAAGAGLGLPAARLRVVDPEHLNDRAGLTALAVEDLGMQVLCCRAEETNDARKPTERPAVRPAYVGEVNREPSRAPEADAAEQPAGEARDVTGGVDSPCDDLTQQEIDSADISERESAEVGVRLPPAPPAVNSGR